MNSSRPSHAADSETPPRGHDAAADVEAGIRDFVRNDIAYLRRPPAASIEETPVAPPASAVAALSEPGQDAASINSVIQRIAGVSLEEIDRLISDLESMRSHLVSEGDRIQREIAGYGHLSQTAAKSTRAIADNVALWKRAAEEARRG